MAVFFKRSTICGLLTAVFALALAACGGGEVTDQLGEDVDPDVSNLPPVAVITVTPEQVASFALVTLDASESFDPDGEEIVGYSWTQTGGYEMELSATDTVQTTFEAPVSGVLTFELVVQDVSGNSSLPASVEIGVEFDPPFDQDVDIMEAVFVSASTGSDDPMQSGSYLFPVKTIGRGIEVAQAASLEDIYVMEGTYEESVSIPDAIALHGCVASVNFDDGAITHAAGRSTTKIKAPAGAQSAVKIAGATGASIECFTVEGGTDAAKSMGIDVADSQDIEIRNVSVSTPGAAGALCQDISIDGTLIASISDADFQNSGTCDIYTAISIDESSDVTVDDADGAVEIEVSPGSESYVKAIESSDSDGTALSGISIDSTAALGATTAFSGIVLGDSPISTVEGNSIAVQGALAATGISMRCTGAPIDHVVEANEIELDGAATAVKGIRVKCPIADALFRIQRNRIWLTPDANAAIPVTGIEVAAQGVPLEVSAVNNVITMTMAASDKADKTGVELSKLGSASAISILHNSFLMMGGTGDIYAIGSDRDSTQFAASGNIMFVYSSSADNALFRLKEACQANYCAKDVVANLVNADFFSTPVKMAYYYDTAATEAMDVINECDLATPPAQCVSDEVHHSANAIDAGMNESYFNFEAGMLGSAHQALVIDLGPVGLGVDEDLYANPRSDGLPDIGPVEHQ